jgi:hypothetical protein
MRDEEHYGMHVSLNIIQVINSSRIRWAGHVERVGKRRDAYTVFVRKPEGKRPL